MAVIDAWDFPGNNGDYAILPNPAGALGHFRTDVGYLGWQIAIIGNVDNVDQAQRGCWWASKRASNDQLNHSFVFEPANNNYEYQYAASAVRETALTEVNGTWVLNCLGYSGGLGDVTFRRIPLSTATQSHSFTGATGGSNASDSQLQEVMLGAYEDSGTVQQELDGQLAIVLIIKGTALTQAELEAFAADPLNYGDYLKSVHGSNCFFWDDSGSDSVIGAPTLVGGVTRGTGNGPDIPARTAPGTDMPILLMNNNLGKVLIR